MFYHNNKWNISTTSVLDAEQCYWISDKSILQLMKDCLVNENWESFCSKHEPEKIYLYTLIHHENIHLIDYFYLF